MRRVGNDPSTCRRDAGGRIEHERLKSVVGWLRIPAMFVTRESLNLGLDIEQRRLYMMYHRQCQLGVKTERDRPFFPSICIM